MVTRPSGRTTEAPRWRLAGGAEVQSACGALIDTTTALLANECQSFLDHLVADLIMLESESDSCCAINRTGGNASRQADELYEERLIAMPLDMKVSESKARSWQAAVDVRHSKPVAVVPLRDSVRFTSIVVRQ